jgi:hypothetical protein
MQTLTESKNNVQEKSFCLSRRELLNYANGRLSEKEKKKVEEHLLECTLCIFTYQEVLNKKESSDINTKYADLFPEPEKKKFELNFISKKKFLTAIAVLAGIVLLFGAYSKLTRDSVSDGNAYSPISEIKKTTAEPVIKQEPAPPPPVAEEKKNDPVPVEQHEITASNDAGKVLNENKPPEKKEEAIKIEKQKSSPVEKQKTVELNNPPPVTTAANVKPDKDPVIKNPAPPVAAYIKNYKISRSPDELPSGNYSQELELIFKQVDQSQYKDALSEIGKFSYDYPGDVNARYYSGYIYYMMEDNEHSLAEMDWILNKRDKVFYEDARWYKALILNRTKKFDEAKKILGDIISQKSSYSSKAKQLQELMGGN